MKVTEIDMEELRKSEDFKRMSTLAGQTEASFKGTSLVELISSSEKGNQIYPSLS